MHNKNVSEVFKDLSSTPNGLSEVEAQTRLKQNGFNQISEKKRKPAVIRFLAQFKDTMVLVLIAAAILSAAIGFARGEGGALTDTAIILVIVVINALIGFVQESKAEKALTALKSLSLPHSKVVRGGKVVIVRSKDLVVGDIVVLEAGDNVPADLRLIESHSLKIQESALTGESAATDKHINPVALSAAIGDRHNMAFSSGTVVYGRGRGIVIHTGMNTQIGKVASMLSDKQPPSPLQKKLSKTGKFISIAVIIIAAIIFAAGLLNAAEINSGVFTSSLMQGVAIAVAAIPEGLPAVTTIIMAFGVQALSRQKAIIRNLPAVETLGCTQVICSDKTGTLTKNKMTLSQTFVLSGRIDKVAALDELNSKEDVVFGISGISGGIQSAKSGSDKDYRQLYNCMALCNDAQLNVNGGKIQQIGDPTETALLEYLYNHNKNDYAKYGQYKRINENPFDSVRKRMSVVVSGGGGQTVYAKGAVDEMLNICDNVLKNGQVVPLSSQDKDTILRANHSMAAGGLRVLAYAFKDNNQNSINHKDEQNLTFIGLTGMIDPPRPEVKEAVRVCKKAGMNAIMITGDHRDTAVAIAKELEIITDETQVLTGKQLDALSDKEYQKIISKIKVYARVSPENKVRIVKAWQKNGKVVAMTGDGVNDAPSLKAADIGVGMGITGTDITKNVADMVLADDNFATIIVAVKEGRKVFANIQKAMQFLFSANIAEVLSLFVVTVFFKNVSFLLPVHLLWINLVTDSVPALALGTERAEEDIMDYPPRKSGSSMFKGRLGASIVYQGVLQTAIVLFIFFFGLNRFGNQTAMTMALVSLCFIQLFHAFNARSDRHSIFSVGVFSNFLLDVAFVLGAGLTYLIVSVPVLNGVFGTVPLSLNQWVLSVSVSLAIIPLVEIVKLIPAIFAPKKKRSLRI